ncbi:aminoglycoside phosphotransferase family protein [Aeromicrobium sp. Leaf350]|uniref:aminoglycoside phosphotransferase family protein n=1 Tax=Aeromicrobium sp. Leaf350 TaxID=2876565 RepID=UPI001E59D19F|nr:aminoglycoside phosphotransferase family protein [Aeromicrobium sp. Leaf350]
MSLLPFDLPASFLAHAERDERWAAWVDSVPRRVAGALEAWELTVDGAPWHGHTALVVPVVADGVPAALKVGWPYEEPRQEWLALRHWDGHGAVRLLRADPSSNVLLLERLRPVDLLSLDDVAACEVVAALYGTLHVPAPPRLDRLSVAVARRTDDLAALPRSAPLPRRLVEQAVHLGRAFASDPATDGTLVHTDLHDENVLGAEREPWLAIDPQPLSGDPHYEPAPMLWNRWEEVVASHDARRTVRRRFHALVDGAGLDEDRARDWVLVREAHNAMWAIEDGDPDRVTVAVTITKAVQD